MPNAYHSCEYLEDKLAMRVSWDRVVDDIQEDIRGASKDDRISRVADLKMKCTRSVGHCCCRLLSSFATLDLKD